MSLQYVIDGYNLLNHRHFRTLVPRGLDGARAVLAVLAAARRTGSVRNQVWVVFDGYPAAGAEIPQGASNVVYSKQRSADEVIMQMVEHAKCAKNIRVVTDDNQIRYFVKSCGAVVLGIDEFLALGAKRTVDPEGRSARAAETTKLSYTSMYQINKELRKKWLKEE